MKSNEMKNDGKMENKRKLYNCCPVITWVNWTQNWIFQNGMKIRKIDDDSEPSWFIRFLWHLSHIPLVLRFAVIQTIINGVCVCGNFYLKEVTNCFQVQNLLEFFFVHSLLLGFLSKVTGNSLSVFRLDDSCDKVYFSSERTGVWGGFKVHISYNIQQGSSATLHDSFRQMPVI